MKKKISQIIYNLIAVKLPISHIKINILGRKIRIYFFKYIRNYLAKNILECMGKNVNIEKGARINNKIKIGDNSGIGINCKLQKMVTIGNNVMMGPEVLIYTENHKTSSIKIPMIAQGMTETKPVTIEDDVWIGTRVIILPGLTIGRGSILGAGTVVTKDIPPFSVVVGNPGRIVKNRKENKGSKR